MNEENQNQNQPAPEFEAEEIKMPENAVVELGSDEKSALSGPIILVLALLLVVIFGGLYVWFNSLKNAPTEPMPAPAERPTAVENNEPESTTAEAQTDNLDVVSTSDEITAIEADIEATDLDSLGTELEAIEAELEAAI